MYKGNCLTHFNVVWNWILNEYTITEVLQMNWLYQGQGKEYTHQCQMQSSEHLNLNTEMTPISMNHEII